VSPPEEKGGSTENARRLKWNTKSLRDETSSVNTFGSPELCVWRVAPGRFWFQTTWSSFARKLGKRSDMRRVEVTGLNHYRQTFEIRGTRRKVQRILTRYLASAPDQFFAASVAQDCSKTVRRVETAARRERRAP
jgi:hypothetical protein